MPIYELQCTACANIEEVLQKKKYTQRQLGKLKCLKCTEVGAMYYIISSGGFILIGDGFYKSGSN